MYVFNPNEDGWIFAVLAPTGLAAFNVNGQTIHRFFKLPIFKGKKGQTLGSLRSKFKLITDNYWNLI